METNNFSAKEKILRAVIELIETEENLEDISIRHIAKKAEVNVALINYYYQSKENLMNQAIEVKLGSIVNEVFKNKRNEATAAETLKTVLINTADLGFRYYKLSKISVATELKLGCRSTCDMVLPLLQEIFLNKSESELKLIALQLIVPFTVMLLYPEHYQNYLFTDFFDEQQRNEKMNQMIDNILLINRD